jgi:hypothetical protein
MTAETVHTAPYKKLKAKVKVTLEQTVKTQRGEEI